MVKDYCDLILLKQRNEAKTLKDNKYGEQIIAFINSYFDFVNLEKNIGLNYSNLFTKYDIDEIVKIYNSNPNRFNMFKTLFDLLNIDEKSLKQNYVNLNSYAQFYAIKYNVLLYLMGNLKTIEVYNSDLRNELVCSKFLYSIINPENDLYKTTHNLKNKHLFQLISHLKMRIAINNYFWTVDKIYEYKKLLEKSALLGYEEHYYQHFMKILDFIKSKVYFPNNEKDLTKFDRERIENFLNPLREALKKANQIII